MKERGKYLRLKKEPALNSGSIIPEMPGFYHKLFLMQGEFVKNLQPQGISCMVIGNNSLPAFKADLLNSVIFS